MLRSWPRRGGTGLSQNLVARWRRWRRWMAVVLPSLRCVSCSCVNCWSPPTRLVPQGAALSRGPSSQSGSTSSRARGPRTRRGPGAHLETQHLLDPSRRLPREETRRFSRPLFFPHFLLRGQKSSPNMCVEVVHVCSEELFCEGPPGVAQSCKGAHGCGIAQVFVPSFRIVCDSC